jgi:hypothetical protein
VGSLLVVVRLEPVELSLELGHRAGTGLLGQVLLQGLMEALDLSARLWLTGQFCPRREPERIEEHRYFRLRT